MSFTEIVTWAIGILLVLASLLTVVRIVTGPSVLDRVVASDVLVSIVICALGAQTALVDGTSTLPILITLSLVVVPLMLAVDRVSAWPTWLAMTVWPLAALALTLVVLPRAKGLLLSVIWATRAPGSERD